LSLKKMVSTVYWDISCFTWIDSCYQFFERSRSVSFLLMANSLDIES
jgi:hypothetical protein